MTAQIANGGYKIKPRILINPNEKTESLEEYVNFKKENPDGPLPDNFFLSNLNLETLFKNQENINFIKDSMFAATNEPGGTSYASRLTKKGFVFAGKTGSSQIKRFTEAQREAEVKQEDIVYQDRDHALFVAFAPYNDPRYAISVIVEHGGSGSKAAAPVAKKVIKKILERHNLRMSHKNLEGKEI